MYENVERRKRSGTDRDGEEVEEEEGVGVLERAVDALGAGLGLHLEAAAYITTTAHSME